MTTHPTGQETHLSGAVHTQPPSDLDVALVDLLRDWLPARRWFPAKGTDVAVEAVGGLPLVDPRGEAEVRIVLVRAESASTHSLLQVPVTLRRPTTTPADGPAVIGTVGDPPRHVRDGCGDPAFLRAWLAAATGSGDAPADLGVDPSRAHVLTGEQSNTSVILPGPGGGVAAGGAILKVFRALSPGANPDVDVPHRLTAGGWWHVPRPLGWLAAEWDEQGGPAEGHLAVLSQFVDGAADGFELACARAGRGESFADLARDLGTVVAEMHAELGAAFGVEDDDDRDRAATVATAIRQRFHWAAAAVPSLRRHAHGVAEMADRVAALEGVPPAQRIHGDLHLGQALRAHDEWFVTDFEGEPLVPLAARTRPDLALRDVAGVLRSIDYAAAVGGAGPGWAADARAALLAGYGTQDATGTALVRALELDKALYEAVYEARNRPRWSAIPEGAVERLLA